MVKTKDPYKNWTREQLIDQLIKRNELLVIYMDAVEKTREFVVEIMEKELANG